jgi:hypothetical protein
MYCPYNYAMYCKTYCLQMQMGCPFINDQKKTIKQKLSGGGIESLSLPEENQLKIKLEVPALKESLSAAEKSQIIKELEGTKIKDILLDKIEISTELLSTKVTVYEA